MVVRCRPMMKFMTFHSLELLILLPFGLVRFTALIWGLHIALEKDLCGKLQPTELRDQCFSSPCFARPKLRQIHRRVEISLVKARRCRLGICPTVLISCIMRTFPFAASVVTSILISLTANGLIAEDWPNWRGPEYSGSRAGASYPTQWAPDRVKWKVPLPGKGASVPAVYGDRI